MDYPTDDLQFNPSPATIAHLDINSCFATCEQQANPFLRGQPLVVAAFDSASAVILAASIEAKKIGIKTGMRLIDARLICPQLISLTPDHHKYRTIHHQIKNVLDQYSASVIPKSIDEFVIDFNQSPYQHQNLISVCQQIKSQIRTQVGEWISVSIGLGPNRFLAKVASNLKKPDGLEIIDNSNYLQIYSRLQLRDLHGVNIATSNLLNCHQIYSVSDFYNSSLYRLKSVFHSIHSLYWYLRLRGFEVDNYISQRQSIGNMHALKLPTSDILKLKTILHKIVLNTTLNLRAQNLSTGAIHICLIFSNHTLWHKSHRLKQHLFDTQDIFLAAFLLLKSCPHLGTVKNIAFSCHNFEDINCLQLELFTSVIKKRNLNQAIDSINNKFGRFSVVPAAVIDGNNFITDAIGFGKI